MHKFGENFRGKPFPQNEEEARKMSISREHYQRMRRNTSNEAELAKQVELAEKFQTPLEANSDRT